MVQRGLSCTDGAATARNERRDPSGSRLCRITGAAEGTGCQDRGTTQLARRDPKTAAPRQSSPNTPENSVFRPYWACGANFIALALNQTEQATHFARSAQKHGDDETNDTTAHPKQGTAETDDTSAPEKRTKNAHFSPQRRRWFQTHTGTSEQRRWRFQTTGPSG